MIRNLGNLNLAASSDRYVAPARPGRIKMLLQVLWGKHRRATHRNFPKNRRRPLLIELQLEPRTFLEATVGLAIGIQRREQVPPKRLDGAVSLLPGTVESKYFGRLVEFDAGPSSVMLLAVAGFARSVSIDLDVQPAGSFLDDHLDALDDATVLVGQNVKPRGRVPALLLLNDHVRPLKHGGVVLEVDAELLLLFQHNGVQAQRQTVVVHHPLKVSFLHQPGIGAVARRDAKQRVGQGRHGLDPEKVDQRLEEIVRQIDEDMSLFISWQTSVPSAGELGGQHGMFHEAQSPSQDGYPALAGDVEGEDVGWAGGLLVLVFVFVGRGGSSVGGNSLHLIYGSLSH